MATSSRDPPCQALQYSHVKYIGVLPVQSYIDAAGVVQRTYKSLLGHRPKRPIEVFSDVTGAPELCRISCEQFVVGAVENRLVEDLVSQSCCTSSNTASHLRRGMQ